jgi:hypothetical protein
MSFLHIAFLGGIAAVTVPIMLHLIMRQQPKHFEFPALRFIQQRKEANRRRLKFRHLLLLLLRCAAIVLLAVALARPSIQASGILGDQEAPVAAALVFDTSPRMEYRLNNNTRLKEAQKIGLWLLAQLPPDSEAAVLDGQSQGSVFAAEMGAARQRVDRLTVTPAGVPLTTEIEDAFRLLSESDKQRKEVYVFSDLSRGAWPATLGEGWRKRMQDLRDVGIYVVDVGALEPRNFSLGELRLSSQILAKNSPLRVQVEITRSGYGEQAGEEERTVELYLLNADRQPVKRSQEVARFGPGDAQTIEFRVAGLDTGVHQGFVKIVGEDNLACDDIRYFTVTTRAAWRVLIAAPERPADYALFLHEAVAPYSLRIKGEAAFDCDVVPLAELATRKLEDYAAVCVLDPTPPVDAIWQKLAAYASGGGGVAIFLGRNAHPLGAFNTAAAQDVLPGKLVRQWRSGEREIALAPGSLQHPLLAKFRSLESAIPWDAFPIFRHWELGPLAEGAGVVIPYSNTLPALIERPVGRGRVLTMTTPISDSANRSDTWNILPTGDEPWPFVMLANETLRYLVGSADARLNYLTGDTVVIPLGNHREPIISLTTPQGIQVRQAVDAEQNALVFAATDTAGNYHGGAGGEDGGIELGFSVNLPREVSQLDRLSDAELKQLFEPAPFRVARNEREIDRSMSAARVGVELYPYAMLLLALVLAAEQVLANRFYRTEKNAPKSVDAKSIAQAMVDSSAPAVAETEVTAP